MWAIRFAQIAGLALLAGGVAAGEARAQQLFIYPQKGQSAEQQAQDKAQCQTWATQQTGFDPLNPPTASAARPQNESTGPGVVGGAAGGAALGAIVGAIAGDAGKGAAIGAAGGGLMGGMRSGSQRRRNDERQRHYEQQQASQAQYARDQFNRAYRTCLEGRGYTVN